MRARDVTLFLVSHHLPPAISLASSSSPLSTLERAPHVSIIIPPRHLSRTVSEKKPLVGTLRTPVRCRQPGSGPTAPAIWAARRCLPRDDTDGRDAARACFPLVFAYLSWPSLVLRASEADRVREWRHRAWNTNEPRARETERKRRQ